MHCKLVDFVGYHIHPLNHLVQHSFQDRWKWIHAKNHVVSTLSNLMSMKSNAQMRKNEDETTKSVHYYVTNFLIDVL